MAKPTKTVKNDQNKGKEGKNGAHNCDLSGLKVKDEYRPVSSPRPAKRLQDYESVRLMQQAMKALEADGLTMEVIHQYFIRPK